MKFWLKFIRVLNYKLMYINDTYVIAFFQKGYSLINKYVNKQIFIKDLDTVIILKHNNDNI